MRRPRGEHRAYARMLLQLDRLRGGLLGFGVTTFEVSFERREQSRLRLLPPARCAVLAHARRHLHGAGNEPHQAVEKDEPRGEQHEQEIQRDLHAVGREHDEHVAVVVARGDDESHGERENRYDPEKRFHYRAGRSRASLMLRTASSVVDMSGSSMLMSLSWRLRRVASALATAFSRVS